MGAPSQLDRLLLGLDQQQRDAVTSTAAPLAIVASAGSGKTTVLTRRIAYRVVSGNAEAKHIVALTFTRDAASELKRRLRRLDLRDRIEAGTFHSVALRLLRDRALANHTAMPNIAPDRLRLVRECLTELGLDVQPWAAMADIDWARARLVDPARFEAVARAERRRTAVDHGRFPDLMAAYGRLKKRKGVIDFDDVLQMVLDAVRSDRAFAELVQWRFRHFFVDEAQDLNPLQHALLESWRAGRPDICLVGDPRQAIYGWNGSDHRTLTEVEERYPGVTVVSLTHNYRCSPQVVRAAAAVLAADGQLDDTASRLPDGPSVAVRTYASEVDEAAAVAGYVRSLLNHRPAGDIAVLARTNDQLTDLQRALSAAGVPVGRAAGRAPIDRVLADAYGVARNQLATWADEGFDDPDPVRRRVAEEVDRFLSSGEPGGFRAWVEAHVPFDDLEQPDDDDTVSLLTFHAAKGREWWAVFVTGVEERLVPHSSAVTKAALAEEARLLYVALTRAAHHLTVTHSTARRGVGVEPSRWLPSVHASSHADLAIAPPASISHAPPDPLDELRQWRASIARLGGVPEHAVCNDRVLRSLLAEPPASMGELAQRLGISETAAARLRPLPLHR